MPAEIFDVEQGGTEWHLARCGLPTASCFADILAEGKGLMRKTYMRKLAAERYSGQVMEGYSNAAMERGNVQEAKIRAAYAFLSGNEAKVIGFAKRGVAGCSPDALIGDKGVLEIKSANPDILFDIIERGDFPTKHKAQCMGALWVLEREWVDIAIGFFPDPSPTRPFPVFIKRAYRDEGYIGELSREVEKFDREVGEMVERVSRYVPD